MQPLLKFNPPPYGMEVQTQLPAVSLKSVIAFLKRSWPIIAGGVAVGIAGGALHLYTATPVYVARTQLAIDPRGSQALPDGQATDAAFATDTPFVQTQVGLLRSEGVILSAIGAEKLMTDPAFMRPGASGTSLMSSLLRSPSTLTGSGGTGTGVAPAPGTADGPAPAAANARMSPEFRRQRMAVEQVLGSLQVEREGLTNIIEIRYQSADPQLPARVANAIARAYISDQLNTKFETSKVAADWLQQRIAELREQSAAASRAVQDFRTRNNLIETSRGRLSEQKLAELNSQLVQQQVQTAEAKARLDRIEQVAASGVPDPATVEVLRSEIITRLRNQFLDLSQRDSEIASRLGAEHPVTLENRRQMAEIRKSMSEELNRIIGSAKSDYEVALTRQKALEDGVAASLEETAAANQAEVTLRELESSEQALKSIYEAFLRRYTETIQTQTFPVASARIITEATPALSHTYPRPKLVMAISALIGLVGGLGLATLRDRTRNVIRFPGEVRDYLGQDLLGVVPRLPTSDPKGQAVYAAHNPTSPLAENLRAILVSLQVDRPAGKARTVAVVSAEHAEGRTVFAANLAWVAASTGLRTLVIDGDMRTARLGALLCEDSQREHGLADLLATPGKAPADLIVRQEAFDVLPAGGARQRAPSDLLGSPLMAQLMQKLEAEYEFIIIDLPPVMPLVDARIVSKLVNAVLFLTAWNKTDRDEARKAIKTLEAAGSTLAGCVLTGTKGKIFSDLG